MVLLSFASSSWFGEEDSKYIQRYLSLLSVKGVIAILRLP